MATHFLAPAPALEGAAVIAADTRVSMGEGDVTTPRNSAVIALLAAGADLRGDPEKP